jgi:hypothetical protein
MDIKNRNCTFTVKDNTYQVSYPSVGQFLAIESTKAILTKGQIGGMLDSGTIMAYKAIEVCSVIAFYKVMCPDFIKKIGEKTRIEDIDLIDFKELMEVYNLQIKPWFDNWYNLYTGVNEQNV